MSRNGVKAVSGRPLRHLWKRAAPLWPFGHKRILLLEDDTSMQKLVSLLLRPLHMKVDVFGGGRDVIASIASNPNRYDALLLDLMMPQDGGLTVLRELRDNHPELLERVILLTASGTTITAPWLPHVFAVVHKPFEGEQLVSTVEECVRRDSAHRQAPPSS